MKYCPVPTVSIITVSAELASFADSFHFTEFTSRPCDRNSRLILKNFRHTERVKEEQQSWTPLHPTYLSFCSSFLSPSLSSVLMPAYLLCLGLRGLQLPDRAKQLGGYACKWKAGWGTINKLKALQTQSCFLPLALLVMKTMFWSPSLSMGYSFRNLNQVLFIGFLKTQQSGTPNTWTNLKPQQSGISNT